MARRSAVTQDIAKMKCVHTELIGVPLANCDANLMKTAFDDQGIIGFSEDFLSLSPDDIMTLPDLTATDKCKLMCAMSYYHSGSRNMKAPSDVTSVAKQMFDDYRSSLCDPTKPVIPWKTPIADPELDKWKRSVKPNGRDFPILKDEVSYLAGRRSFLPQSKPKAHKTSLMKRMFLTILRHALFNRCGYSRCSRTSWL